MIQVSSVDNRIAFKQSNVDWWTCESDDLVPPPSYYYIYQETLSVHPLSRLLQFYISFIILLIAIRLNFSLPLIIGFAKLYSSIFPASILPIILIIPAYSLSKIVIGTDIIPPH